MATETAENQDVNQEVEVNSSETSETVEQSDANNTEQVVEEIVEEVVAQTDGRDTRIAELSENNRQLNELLSRTIDQMNLMRQQPQEDTFDPNASPEEAQVRKNARAAHDRMSRMEQNLGQILEQQDLLSIKTDPTLGPKYSANSAAVETLRREKMNQGRYLPREEALALVLARKGETSTTQKVVKKIVKQAIKPAGVTKQSSGTQVKEQAQTGKTAKERLQGKSF